MILLDRVSADKLVYVTAEAYVQGKKLWIAMRPRHRAEGREVMA